MSPGDEVSCLHVLRLLEAAHDATLARMATEIARMAAASQSRVRRSAEDLVRRSLDTAVPALQSVACSGKSAQRGLALRLLGAIAQEHGGSDLWAFTWQTAHADPGKAATDLRAEWLAAGFGERLAPTTPPVEVLAAPLRTGAPDNDALARFWTQVRESIDVDNGLERELHAKYKRQGHAVRLKLTRQPGTEMAEALRHCLHAEGWRDGPRPRVDRLTAWNHMAPAMVALAEAGDLSPDAALRMLWFFDVIEDGGLLEPVWDVFTAMRRRTGHPTLLALRSLVEAAGVSGDEVTSAWPRYGTATEADWPGEAVWPYLQTHLHEVVRDLEARLGSRDVMYRAIAAMPSPPEPLLGALFEIALGSSKARAKEAQVALAGHPELPRRLAAARADKRAAVRKNAEAWAERLG